MQDLRENLYFKDKKIKLNFFLCELIQYFMQNHL